MPSEFEIIDNKIIFPFNGIDFSQDDIRKLLEIVTDLVETQDWEWPHRGPELRSKAATLIGRSSR